MIDFYFFHIGNDNDLAQMMINSIKFTNKNSKIYQLTDKNTPQIDKVDDCYRFDGNKNNIMKFRMEAYSKTQLNKNRYSLFLDTDMLVLKKLNLSKYFKNSEVLLCKREINVHQIVNIDFNNMDMQEYNNKSVGEVWPYLGCLIGVKNSSSLIRMNQMYNNLEEKYKIWYGDQIILKTFVHQNYSKTSFVGELEYAHVPSDNKISKDTKIIHFKGNRLKPYMKICYEYFFKHLTKSTNL